MINPNAYYTVQGWMREGLGLSGNALAVYAIIHGFSQDGASEYAGSARYLAEWLGCSKKTILRVLAELTESGHLIKKTYAKNGVTFCNYITAIPATIEAAEGGDKISLPGTNLPQGGDKMSPGVGTNLPQGGDKMSPGVGTNLPQGGDKMSSHNTRDIKNINNTNIQQNEEGTSPAPPPAPKVSTAEIDGFFETIWKLYPQKKGKADVSEKKRRELYKIGFDEMKRAVERYVADLQKDSWRQPQYGSTFFNSGYVDYLDKNYEPSPPLPARPAARGYGAPAGHVGPNGIAYDPSKNDLDAHF